MDNIKDLFHVELKNLYAMEKQIQETLSGLKEIKHAKLKKRVENFGMANTIHFIKIQSLLQKNSINPGNTVDSIAKEILDNINSIENSDIAAPLKEAGLATTFNRLAAYKKTNYANAYNLAKYAKKKKLKKKLRKIYKKTKKQQSKIEKVMTKSVFKDAVKSKKQ